MINQIKNTLLPLLLLLYSLIGQAQLAEGDLMFVGFNADGSDGLAIVTLKDIPANTTIYFTDNEWNGMAIGSGGAFNDASEGELTWNTGPTIIPAGTVVNFITRQAPRSADIGSISGMLDPNAANEVLYAFVGTDDLTPTVFLSAITNAGFNNTRGTLTGTGLIEGQTAIRIQGNDDVLVYQGDTICGTTTDACRMFIADPDNWASEGGGGDQSMDGGIDFPGSVPISFIGSALPVRLVLFTGQYLEGKVHIQWTTASETDNDYFELLRSADGLNFLPVYTANGYGTTTTPQTYNYLDVVDPEPIGYYYQLRQVDIDGDSEKFEIIYVPTAQKRESLWIYASPRPGGPIRFNRETALTSAVLINSSGKTLKRFSDLELHHRLIMPFVNPGVYWLHVQTENQSERFRMVIQ